VSVVAGNPTGTAGPPLEQYAGMLEILMWVKRLPLNFIEILIKAWGGASLPL
jgi:hypothetical protein